MSAMTVTVRDLPLSTENYNRSRRAFQLIAAAMKELQSIPVTCDERLSHDLTANQCHRFGDALSTVHCLMMCNKQKPFSMLGAVEWSLKHALIDD